MRVLLRGLVHTCAGGATLAQHRPRQRQCRVRILTRRVSSESPPPALLLHARLIRSWYRPRPSASACILHHVRSRAYSAQGACSVSATACSPLLHELCHVVNLAAERLPRVPPAILLARTLKHRKPRRARIHVTGNKAQTAADKPGRRNGRQPPYTLHGLMRRRIGCGEGGGSLAGRDFRAVHGIPPTRRPGESKPATCSFVHSCARRV